MSMLLHAPADDLSRGDVQCGKQRGGSIALVLVGHRGGATFLKGQPRLGAIQCFNLAPFIAGKYQSMFRWVEVEPRDPIKFFGEMLVTGEFESAA